MIRVTRFRLVSLYLLLALYAGMAAWFSPSAVARGINLFMVCWWTFFAATVYSEKTDDEPPPPQSD